MVVVPQTKLVGTSVIDDMFKVDNLPLSVTCNLEIDLTLVVTDDKL